MIDIDTYRNRIGTFTIALRQRNIVKNKGSHEKDKLWTHSLHILCILLICATSLSTFVIKEKCGRISTPVSIEKHVVVETDRCGSLVLIWNFQELGLRCRFLGLNCKPNFLARYKFGNKNNAKSGIISYHLNIRSLRNKVCEVKVGPVRKSIIYPGPLWGWGYLKLLLLVKRDFVVSYKF